MQTANTVKTRATKLQEVLGTMGYVLNPSQCLNVVADIETPSNVKSYSHAESNNRPPSISEAQIVAEKYLDSIVEAFMTEDYDKATQYTEAKYLVNFTEREFRRSVQNSREDLGSYMRREFLGSLKAETHPEEENTFPDHVRYVWRGIFEKNEGLLIMGLYLKNGTYYTSDISCK